MAKEKQKMTLNVRQRNTRVATSESMPPEIDPAKIEAFASGAENAQKNNAIIPATAPSKKLNAIMPVAEQKVVRDAFTMPAHDHELFSVIQNKCLSMGLAATKSEILRAGLKNLASLEAKALVKIIKAVPKIKTGRPVVKP